MGELKAKAIRTVNLSASDRPPEAVVPDATQMASSTTAHTQRSGTSLNATIIDKEIKSDPAAKNHIRTPTQVAHRTSKKHQEGDAVS